MLDVFSGSGFQTIWPLAALFAVGAFAAMSIGLHGRLRRVLRTRQDEVSGARHAAVAQLYDAVEAIPQALALFDAEDRVVAWNSHYAELTRECAPALRVGASFRELLEAGLDAGHYPEAFGRREAWLDARLEARRNAPSTVEQHTSDDRWQIGRAHV